MKKWRFWLPVVLMGFLLGIHDGHVALWRDDDPEPVQVFPFSASMLPPADQNALAQGIRIESREQLNKLLEDFLS